MASGIGIKIAKWLNLSILRSLQAARFANVVIFAIMAFLAIAIVPRRKLFFLFYFVMPINVFFAISLGTDSFINGLLGLAIALIYYVKCKEGPMSVAEYIILIIMLCAIPCAKSTYAPVLLLLGLIEHEKLPGKLKPAIHYIIAIVLMLGMFGFTYWYGSRYGIALWPKPNVDSSLQISYILHNPFTVAWTFIHQTFDGLKLYVIDKYGIFGHMGNALWEGFVMIPGLLALSLIDTRDTRGRFYRIKMIQGDGPSVADSQDNEASTLTKYNVFWGVLTILGCFGLSMLALYITYTEVGSDEVEGFQGRYCIPIALIIYTLIMFTKRLRIKLKSDVIPTVICFGLMIAGYAGIVSVLGRYNM